MKTFGMLDEFKAEAANALFTKAQATAVTAALLEKGKREAATEEKARQIDRAASSVMQYYLDPTESETDSMLDSLGVARISADDIVRTVEMLLFDAE